MANAFCTSRRLWSGSCSMHGRMPVLRLLTGSRHALERRLADEVANQRRRDPLGALPVVVGGTLMRPYLRRRLAVLTGGHLNVRLMTVGELGLRLGHGRLVRAG